MNERLAILDPLVIILPTNATTAQVQQYLGRVHVWADALGSHPESYVVSEAVVNRLMELDRYPSYQQLSSLITTYEISNIAAYDVANCLSVIASRRPFLEDKCGVAAIVTQGFSVVPELILTRLPDAIASTLADCLLLGCLGTCVLATIRHLHFASCDIDTQSHQSLRVQGQIDLAEVDSGQSINLPVTIDCPLPVLLAPGAVRLAADVIDLCLDPPAATACVYSQLPLSERTQQLPPVLHVALNLSQASPNMAYIINPS